jgi:hypothetical protein
MTLCMLALDLGHAHGRMNLRGGSGHTRFAGSVRTMARCHD